MKRVWVISDTLTCRDCEKSKPIDDFVSSNDRPMGKKKQCKECNSAYNKKRREENPEVAANARQSTAKWRKYNPESDRRKHLLRKFNITLEEYNDLLSSQGGVCAICCMEETVVRRSKSGKEMLAVDHCHETGKIRGLLCFKCNTALGALGDTVEDIQRVIDYLNRSSEDA